jgi:hypothetical protein
VSRTQRLIGWLACMAVAICSVGVPLPAQSVRKSGDPFPCQHCACGCKDADSCWRNCCCHTQREKLAWAKRHGVTPPAFVIAAARREACCDKGQTKTCCSSRGSDDHAVAMATPSCCSKKTDNAKLAVKETLRERCSQCMSDSERQPPPHAGGERNEPRVVLLLAKLRCSGLTLSLSLLPPSLAPQPISFAIDRTMHYEHLLLPALLYEPPYLPVAAPPPDALLA